MQRTLNKGPTPPMKNRPNHLRRRTGKRRGKPWRSVQMVRTSPMMGYLRDEILWIATLLARPCRASLARRNRLGAYL